MPTNLVVRSESGFIQGRFSVERATTPEQWAVGLMGRETLSANTGMLFIFPDVAPRTFWMKDTLIPLDMAFADADGMITKTAMNVAPCTTTPCPRVHGGDAQYVLELPGGTLEALGITEGATLEGAAMDAV